jgi:hypothetical protein
VPVPTAALGAPSGPAVPVPSAAAANPIIAAHNYKPANDEKKEPIPAETVNAGQGEPKITDRAGTGRTTAARAIRTPDPKSRPQNAPPRKPAASVPQAPKERKIAAHGASRG